MVHDEFLLLSRRLLDQRTSNEHRQAQRIAKPMNYNNFNPNIDLLNKAKLLRRKERANLIIPHYDASEKRFTHYKKEIPQVLNDTYHSAPLGDVKLIVGTRNNPNLSKELIRKSPYIKKSKNNNKPTIN